MTFTRQTLLQLKQALREDIGKGDITSRLVIPERATGRAAVFCRGKGIFCGEPVLRKLLAFQDRRLRARFFVRDGGRVRAKQKVLEIRGPVRSILAAERTLLNFMGHLSGIATQTAAFVARVRPYRVRILDTRKTMPLWRELEKYAVRTGGGVNHRRGLDDAVFIKENHRPHGRFAPLRRAAGRFIMEARNLREVSEALMMDPGVILLDNFKPAALRKAVALVRRARPRTLLEASGGIRLANVRRYAAAGVDRISVGALTHSVRPLDFSLLVEP